MLRISIMLTTFLCTMMCISGCRLDEPALQQEFTSSTQVNFSVKGEIEHRFDPLSWQSVFSPSSCEFTMCNDNMSDYYKLRCDRIPSQEGETLECDAEWTVYSDIKTKKSLEFQVVKIDPESDAVWLWCASSRIGAVVMAVGQY